MKPRAILTIVAVFALVLVAVTIVIQIAVAVFGPGLAISPPPTAFIAGSLGQFESPGVYAQFKGEKGLFLVQLPNDQLITLSAISTHLGCTVNWLPSQ